MPARFRYGTADGREVEVPDLEALERHARDGRLVADAPLYDAETDLLAPAGEHDAFRRAAEAPDPGPSAEPDAPAGDRSERPTSDLPDLGVTLAAPEEVVETTDQIVRRLEEERARDLEDSPDRGGVDPVLVDPYNATLRSWDEPEHPTRSEVSLPPAGPGAYERPRSTRGGAEVAGGDAGSTGAEGDEDAGRRRARGSHGARRERPGRESPWASWEPMWLPASPSGDSAPGSPPGSAAPVESRPTKRGGGLLARASATLLGATAPTRTGGTRVRSGLAAALILALLGGAGSLLTGAETEESREAVDPHTAVAAAGSAPLDPAGIADRLAASEGIAFAHMVDGMADVAGRHRVERVPGAWLEGGYFAGAADHPEVRAYWTRYTGFVEELRRRDRDLFRESFVERLESLDLGGAVVSLRLAQAMHRFESSRPRRDTVYTRMEELARSALDLHDLLAARSDELRYEPVVGPGISRDPFLQVHAEDPRLKEEIWVLLERIFDGLEALHGETRWSRDRMNEGVLEGLRATGT